MVGKRGRYGGGAKHAKRGTVHRENEMRKYAETRGRGPLGGLEVDPVVGGGGH